ncbi:hypothetical protein HRQ65_00875 [Tatlockia micdadei]|uniref:hypothetical protein n=1 Tax=Legionella micdadei TaxID=451 RepID=UPI00156D66AF|nr:hypothetical protein [Legionella micdadei]NSL16931.1 hypothetical protein [Legionella micdadei]
MRLKIYFQIPLYAVMGSFHLSGRSVEKIFYDTVHDMQQFDLKMIIPDHCTGWRAVNALGNTFGDNIVVPSAVGRLYQFKLSVFVVPADNRGRLMRSFMILQGFYEAY